MIKLENVSKYYHNDGLINQGLNKINLSFSIGEFVAITGESGSGKSTLLNVISGFDSYEDGELIINGIETSAFDEKEREMLRKDMVSFVFQNYNLIDSFTVLKNVETALLIRGIDRKMRRKRALEYIDRVGLRSHIHHRASKLSGGQKQKLGIARALALNTPLIIADEPTGNLDSESGREVLKLLHDISLDRLVIVVTHNFEAIKPYATRKIRLSDGEVVEDVLLRQANTISDCFIVDSPKRTWKDLADIVRFNLFSQPKKTFFILLIGFTVLVSLFLLTGFHKQSLYSEVNTTTKLNDYPKRIMVRRADNKPLEEADLLYFQSIGHVDSIIKEDPILDLHIEITDEGDSGNHFYRPNPLNENVGFITTKIKETEIYGRLPIADDEIFISILKEHFYGDDLDNSIAKLNQGVTVTFEKKYTRTLKLVGFCLSDDIKTKYVITPGLMRDLYQETILRNSQINITYTDPFNHIRNIRDDILIDPTLEGNTIKISSDFSVNEDFPVLVNGIAVTPISAEIKNIVYISQDVYENLNIDYYYQYTLNLTSPAYAESIIRTLYKKGYYGFSPFFSKNLDDDNLLSKFIYRGTLYATIIILYVICYLVIKTIMTSRIRDFSILRIIGLEQKQIRQIVYSELLFLFLSANLLFSILLLPISILYPDTIGEFAGNMKLTEYLIFFGYNLLIAMAISFSFNKHLKKKLLTNLLAE